MKVSQVTRKLFGFPGAARHNLMGRSIFYHKKRGHGNLRNPICSINVFSDDHKKRGRGLHHDPFVYLR